MAALYGFARTADDLADEGDATPTERLADLTAYRADLAAVVDGAPPSPRWQPVFRPLAAAIESHQLPIVLLTDLLSAFEQDVVQQRYADRAELLDYCRRSANPVGRLLLHLYGVGDAESLRQSDAICTALQLANFWQDLSIDTRRGRVYIPEADCARGRVEAAKLLRQEDDSTTRALVRDMVGWARETMRAGAPLVHALPGRAGWELRFVVQGGLAILDKIEALGFASLTTRPTIKPLDAPRLFWRALWMRPAATSLARNAA